MPGDSATPAVAPGTLTVIIPIRNERNTIHEVIERVSASPVPKEIIVVDDGSDDGTTEILREMEAGRARIRVLYQKVNQGKGAAIRAAIPHAQGEYIIIQDGDLEYDPRDFPMLLEPLLDGRADAVFGSRFLGGPHRVLYFWHSIGNRCLTLLSNVFTNFNLTDMEVCYKAMRRSVAASLDLESQRFGIEPEITAKLARGGWRLYEVPVSYAGRSYEEGKKIGWRDGVAALVHIVRFRFL